MMQQYMKELAQEPFDAEEFIERLAWRTIAETKKEGETDFNPTLLHDCFVQAIKDLKLLEERQQKKCERLEATVREDQLIFYQEIQGLQERNKGAVQTFQELDGKINNVATKVLHLGDQLDSVNGPRARVVEAQKLMMYLNEFLAPGSFASPLFTDPFKIDEAADVIQKLYVIGQDLPTKFEDAKTKIEKMYDNIERSLIEEFCAAQRKQNLQRMKEIAQVLRHFKGYSHCIDAFIETSQTGCLLNKDVFGCLLPLCKDNNQIIQEVFDKPEQVMAKFVLNIYHLKLQEYIEQKLSQKMDTYNYLRNLYELYSKTNQLSASLSIFNMGNDSNYLNKLTSKIFQKYIDNYISLELKCLRDRSASSLQKYYESKNHQKKQIQSGGFQDLRRDLQAVIGTRANINIAQIENYGGETFLSEELAITILQDTKHAFQRCQLLSRPEERAANATQLLDCLLGVLLTEHVDYALELGLQGIPVAEISKPAPKIYFFTIVHQSSTIIHLFEKQLSDLIIPLVANTPKYSDCMQKKKFVMDDVERKVNLGLDRSLNVVTTWVKLYLQAEQKKNDFKPESDDFDTVASPACKSVTQYLVAVIKQMQSTMDGNNVSAAFQELGIRLHRVIYDHMLQFQYNTPGAMIAICDLNEYRQCTRPLGPQVAQLFDTLHALCNLLLVKPENLQQVCSEDSLVKRMHIKWNLVSPDRQCANLDRSVLNNFIQLRSDFKSQKQSFLKV